MPSLLRFRLSLMMLLQYAVMGSVLPILSLYLRNNLGFSGTQTGTVLAMSALAASTAPFVGALVADKLLSAERLLAVCHLLAAVLMLLLSRLSSFWLVLLLYLCYMVAIRPTIALTNAVAFHHMPGERSRFAGIRLWGTVGWMVVGWVFSYVWLRGDDAMTRLPHALMLASGLSLCMFVH
ncbi:MAG: MFS transporter, partial [Chitinivibrionales bacterium]|nr:MFS transporter [Chitinivibrionales bacterium]